LFVFYGEKKPKKSALSKISNFLFTPIYEVNNLNFHILEKKMNS